MVNGKEDIPVDRNDRRYCVIFSAQQCVEDIVACGMNTAYWRDLYDWLEADGTAIVTDWLYTKEIKDEFNPVLLDRAPDTTSLDEALEVSLDPVELAIQEGILSEVKGLREGWVSYSVMSDYLQEHKVSASHNRISKALQDLGYIKHPGLSSGKNAGRSAYPIAPEGDRKVRLYVKEGHLSINMATPKDITMAYEKAQGYAIKPNEVFNDGLGTV